MSNLSEINYLVSPNTAYPPCVGGGYLNVQPGTQANKLAASATLLATGAQYTVTPDEDLPLMLLLIGGRTFDLDATWPRLRTRPIGSSSKSPSRARGRRST